MFLDGDHSIGAGTPNVNNAAPNPWRNTMKALGTNLVTAAWTDSSQHQKQGNIGLADGSVQGWSISGLRSALSNTGDNSGHTQQGGLPAGANRLVFPGCPDTPASP